MLNKYIIFHMKRIVLFLFFITIFMKTFHDMSILADNQVLSRVTNVIQFSFLFMGFLLHAFEPKIVVKYHFIFFITTIIFLFSLYYNGKLNVVLMFMYMISLINIDYRKIIKYTFIAQLIAFILIVSLYYMQIIPERVLYRINGIPRHSLGFWHPNSIGLLFNSLVIQFLIYKKNFNKILIFTFILGSSIIIYQFTNSRTTLALVLFIILLYFILLKFFNNDKKILNKYFSYTYNLLLFIVIFGSLFISYIYNPNNDFFYFLDNLISGRISRGKTFIEQYGIHYFGAYIQYFSNNDSTSQMVGFEYSVLDNAYLQLILNNGLLLALMYYIYNIKFFKKALYSENKFLILYSIFILFLGISEQSILSSVINVPFLLSNIFIVNSTKERGHDN